MARRTGVNGTVKIGGAAVANVNGWTYTAIANTGEVTVIGDEDQQFDYTTRGGTAVINMQFEETDAQTKAIIDDFVSGQTLAKIWCQLQTLDTASDEFSFSAVVNSVEIGVSANELDTMTINVTKSGSLLSVPTT